MATVFLVCGPTGVGKTTYAVELAEKERALRLSIDPWMQTLFMADAGEIDFAWMMERIARCETQMWCVAEPLLALGVGVVLDLGFSTAAHRAAHVARARSHGAEAQLHFLDAPTEVRRGRVERRNRERDPRVFAYEVTSAMFEFMEPRFEPPTAEEIASGARLVGR